MTPEENFIKKVEVFISDPVIINDVVKKRLLMYLNEYKAELPEKVLFKRMENELRYIPTKHLERRNIPKKPMITDEIMEMVAKDICKQQGANFKEFKQSEYGKSSYIVTQLRREFCWHIMENYQCTQQIIKNFFNVNHATIVYYLRGKKIKTAS
jgi:hypothetical protein